MKNVLVANYQESKGNSAKHYPKEELEKELKAQIENSLQLKWNPKDIWVVTNFAFSYMGIGAFYLPLNQNCLTGSKSFVMRELFRAGMMNDDVWIHDLDAWQCVEFDCPEFLDVGIANYSRPKYNGGSVFYSPNAEDIVEDICSEIESNSEAREEPTLTRLFKEKYSDRVTEVDYGFNLGCSGYRDRWIRAEKPIKVVHFHPANRLAWDTHARNRNNVCDDAVIPLRLRDLFVSYWRDKIAKYTYEDKADPFQIRKDWTGVKHENNPWKGKKPLVKKEESDQKIHQDRFEFGTDKLANVDLYDSFLEMSDDQLSDPKYLSEFIYWKVGLNLNVRTLNINDNLVRDCWGGVEAKQYPDELGKLLAYLYKHRNEINSYFEIGVERGGTFFVIDSFLRACNPKFDGSFGIDIDDKIVHKHDLKSYRDRHDTVVFRQVSSRDCSVSKVDLALIDGDHSYEGVKADYEAMKNKARFLVFHDIYLEDSGVKKLWNEITDEYPYEEFLNENYAEFPAPIGIGLIKTEL